MYMCLDTHMSHKVSNDVTRCDGGYLGMWVRMCLGPRRGSSGRPGRPLHTSGTCAQAHTQMYQSTHERANESIGNLCEQNGNH